MKIFTESSPLEAKVREVEATMQRLGIRLSWTYNGFLVEDTKLNAQGIIIDTESRDKPTTFPRQFEGERLKLPET